MLFKKNIGFLVLIFMMAASLALAAPAGNKPVKKKSAFQIESASFEDGRAIPPIFTCTGRNFSPELRWKGAPAKTKTFALICDDPDAPMQTWVHWVIYNIPVKKVMPGDVYQLLENFPRDAKLTNGIQQGTNDSKKVGYDGPCPPSGIHRYYFKLYALDCILDLPAGVMKSQLEKAMKGHVLAWTQMMGTYTKEK
jgi:Raf kinase inhibitor-like YbhB/YbcL family protein